MFCQWMNHNSLVILLLGILITFAFFLYKNEAVEHLSKYCVVLFSFEGFILPRVKSHKWKLGQKCWTFLWLLIYISKNNFTHP